MSLEGAVQRDVVYGGSTSIAPVYEVSGGLPAGTGRPHEHRHHVAARLAQRRRQREPVAAVQPCAFEDAVSFTGVRVSPKAHADGVVVAPVVECHTSRHPQRVAGPQTAADLPVQPDSHERPRAHLGRSAPLGPAGPQAAPADGCGSSWWSGHGSLPRSWGTGPSSLRRTRHPTVERSSSERPSAPWVPASPARQRRSRDGFAALPAPVAPRRPPASR